MANIHFAGRDEITIRLRWWHLIAALLALWVLVPRPRDSNMGLVDLRRRPPRPVDLPTVDIGGAPIISSGLGGAPGQDGVAVEQSPPPDNRPSCLLYSFFNLSEFFECAPDAHLWCKKPDDAPAWAMTPHVREAAENSVQWKDIVIAVTTTSDRLDYLEAISRSWLTRMGEDVRVVIAGAPAPEDVPKALRDRKDVVFWRYAEYESYNDLDKKVQDVLGRLEKEYAGRKYFLKMDDDTLMIPKNLFRLLNALDRVVPADEPIYFGKANCGPKEAIVGAGNQSFCHGQGGAYGMNRQALRVWNNHSCAYWDDMKSIIDRGESKNKKESEVEEWIEDGKDISRYEDVMVARCFQDAGGIPVLGCESFFPQSPLNYMFIQRDGRVVPNRIRTNPISFHHVTPSAMEYLDEFVHSDGNFGKGVQFDDAEKLKQLVRDCRKESERMVCSP